MIRYFHQIKLLIFLRGQPMYHKLGLDFSLSAITELCSPIIIWNALAQLATQISCYKCLSQKDNLICVISHAYLVLLLAP